eukprot:13413305-Ditylum_brightwellii.AAC.1
MLWEYSWVAMCGPGIVAMMAVILSSAFFVILLSVAVANVDDPMGVPAITRPLLTSPLYKRDRVLVILSFISSDIGKSSKDLLMIVVKI